MKKWLRIKWDAKVEKFSSSMETMLKEHKASVTTNVTKIARKAISIETKIPVEIKTKKLSLEGT